MRLGSGELVAAAMFAFVAVLGAEQRLDGTEARVALWCALAPLLVVLVQAGAYWLLARQWVTERSMPVGLARVFRAMSVADGALLVAGLVGVVVWLPEQPLLAVFIVGVWVFGVVEFVNYFVVRLAYPVRRWFTEIWRWRTPRLALDIAESLRR